MPLFKIQYRNSSRILIKAENISEIKEKSIQKLNLSEEKNYKLLLQHDLTEMDDDELLIEYVEQYKDIVVLVITESDRTFDLRYNNDENICSSNLQSPDTNSLTSNNSDNHKQNESAINLDEHVWGKVSNEIIVSCKKGEKLRFTDRKSVIQKIVDYMVDILKDTSRGKATDIAKVLCQTYPKTFSDNVDLGVSWGAGYESVRLEIYNACLYRKSTKKRVRPIVNSSDSDDTEQNERAKEKPTKKQDQYGCVEYAPLLPEGETDDTQENKISELLSIYKSKENIADVARLMKETYPTLRAYINNNNRNLRIISEKWPFLQQNEYFIQHASILLGKDVTQVWMNSLLRRMKPIRQYLKYSKLKVEIKEMMVQLLDECANAMNITKDVKPKQLVVFKMLLLYFHENEQFLFRIVQRDASDTAVKEATNTDYPLLLIRGQSIYDGNAKCVVIINKDVVIDAKDAVDGILITVISYYVFGYCYPPDIEKTLELIQRVFLKINPPTGGKRASNSKRRQKSFDSAVLKLVKAVSEFSNEFNLNE